MLYLFEFEDSEFLWDGDEAWSGLLWSSISLMLPAAESNKKQQASSQARQQRAREASRTLRKLV